ncbi:MAG: hypothetical protein A2513_02850 [Sulfurimonas sp. RIFOXYD12_FULL_33_39]|uniref:hypothetical protein n=1 Tax=unclassified Sulfurimonas TaxID=2623549 RepID=UPI0008CB0E89|nr:MULTISPECIES: hypothetical protein [unclassified Sulfurimonas]OHE08940.1 MAG: hypothetical protein A2513_02850 [Sulfurimonas sp. RIFOXYD12_FULL_33_39]OHE14250.1 MAG: hypothetical protein A2530_06150 [Sulfurimonas sp. RIFOXYD2_FULL_34_21]
MLTTKDISNLLLFTPQGVNKWKKEKRPIIFLLEKYFSKEDIEEFLQTGAIMRYETPNTSLEFLESFKSKYFNFIHVKMRFINSLSEYQLDFYFSYLFFIKVNHNQFSIHDHPFYSSLSRFALDNKQDTSRNDKDSLHIVYDIIDFLENEKMWDYFIYVVQNDFKPFIQCINLDDYFLKDGITEKVDLDEIAQRDNISEQELDEIMENYKSPLSVAGLDHYYLYHQYNHKRLKA